MLLPFTNQSFMDVCTFGCFIYYLFFLMFYWPFVRCCKLVCVVRCKRRYTYFFIRLYDSIFAIVLFPVRFRLSLNYSHVV